MAIILKTELSHAPRGLDVPPTLLAIAPTSRSISRNSVRMLLHLLRSPRGAHYRSLCGNESVSYVKSFRRVVEANYWLTTAVDCAGPWDAANRCGVR